MGVFVASLDWPVYLILTPGLGALLVVLVGWLSRSLRNWLVVLTLLANLWLALRLRTPAAPAGMSLTTVEASGRQLTFTLHGDALGGLLLVLLAAGALLVAFAAAELAAWPSSLGGAVAFLLAVAAANGAFLAGDLLTFYGFAELSSVFLFLLLLAEPDTAAQRAGFKLFAAVAMAGFALLLAILLLLAKRAVLDLSALQSLAGLGVVAQVTLVAVAARAGFAPLHSWLTGALHSASWPAAGLIGVLAAPIGCYLLLRLAAPPAAAGLPLQSVLLVLGIATVLVAGYAVLQQHDLRQAIATLVVAQGGFFALALAAGGALGKEAALAQLAYTVLFVPLPFIALGSLPGSGDGAEGLRSAVARRPLAGLALAVALLSAAGLPPFYGFFARTYVLQALLSAGSAGHLLGAFALLLSSGALLAAMAKLVGLLFAGEGGADRQRWWQGRRTAAVPVAVAAIVTLAFAAAPLTLHRWLLGPASTVALRLPEGAAPAGVTLGTALAGTLLIVALVCGGWTFLTAGRRSPLPAAKTMSDIRLRPVVADIAYLAKAGYFDPYNLAVVVTGVGRAVAIALGRVLDRLAI